MVEHVLDRLDPRRDAVKMVERLLAFAATEPEPPILFYDADSYLLFVSRERERLAAGFRFVIADASLVEAIVDKEKFQELAERLDLPVPAARTLRAADPSLDEVDLRLPLVIKPLTRQHETWRPLSRTKAMRIDSAAELAGVTGELRSRGLDVIAQEAVPGGEDRIESYHVYVDADGVLVADFTGRKLRTFPAQYGYTTALTLTNERDLRDLGRELVRRLGLTGVAKLDFKRAPDGQLWLLEVNPRFNLWHHPGAIGGVNLPQLVYRDLVGLPRAVPPSTVRTVRWCSPRHDLRAARKEGWGVVRWLRFLRGCDAIAGFALDDPLPLPRAAVARAVSRLRQRGSRR